MFLYKESNQNNNNKILKFVIVVIILSYVCGFLGWRYCFSHHPQGRVAYDYMHWERDGERENISFYISHPTIEEHHSVERACVYVCGAVKCVYYIVLDRIAHMHGPEQNLVMPKHESFLSFLSLSPSLSSLAFCYSNTVLCFSVFLFCVAGELLC